MSRAPTDFSAADPRLPAFFRYRRLDDSVVATNQAGQFVILSSDEFQGFVDGALDPASEVYGELDRLNFFRASADVADLGRRLARRKSFLRYGPNLHIAVVTLRCNETCVYCHSSRAPMDAQGVDMSVDTATQVVDRAFETTSPWLTIEFQGGEPLVNFPVIRHIVEYAEEKNRTEEKFLEFTLVSNLSLMDDEKLAFLMDHRVQVCTSIDGPAALHNAQRKLPGGDAYAEAVKWIARTNEAYVDAGLDPRVYHVEALPTLTRPALEQPEAIIDTFLALGCKAIFLRPLDPFGFAAQTRARYGYDVEDYLAFYRRAVDHILELNRSGTEMVERYAAIFLTKILSGEDPNFLDIRSPCGAAIGQIAYDYDGRLFVCDEGRMLAQMGDDFFHIGEVSTTSYREAVTHDTVKAIALASNLDASPQCVDCAYNPYCGICPVVNYATQGSLHGQMRTSRWCAVHMGIQDYLFRRLRDADAETRAIFERWITVRPRDHYLHYADEA